MSDGGGGNWPNSNNNNNNNNNHHRQQRAVVRLFFLVLFFLGASTRAFSFVLFEREERSRKFPHEQEGRRERWKRARPSLSLSFSLSRGALFVFVRAALFVV